MLNSEPPAPEYTNSRFPTLPAFYNTITDTVHDPPHPFYHMKFIAKLRCYMSYLSLYTLPGGGITDMDKEETSDRILIPEVLTVVAQMKEENQPWLIQQVLPTTNNCVMQNL